MKIITSTLVAMFLLAASGYGQETLPYKTTGYGQINVPGKQFLYVLESRGPGFFRIDITDGTVTRVGECGGMTFDWDSKGNLYTVAGPVTKISPDGKRTPFIKGFGMCIGIAIDSHDNLYTSEYNKHDRTFKIPLSKITDDMLPITVTHPKDASGKENLEVDADIKPEGAKEAMIILQRNVPDSYSFWCDAWDNCYFTQNGPQIIWKYSPEGKVSRFGYGAYWARAGCPDANGEFYHLGGDIVKVATNGLRIGMFAPSADLNHPCSIDLDAQGNLYQGQPCHVMFDQKNPPKRDATGTPLDINQRGIIYKYTPDGRRSVLAYCGTNPFGIRMFPKNKFPTVKPAE